ncbi:MAG TPA: HTH domain-containing protein [Xanthomonadaceae bacterium]
MKLKDIVIEVLTESGKSMHVNDIASAAVAKYPNLPDPPEQLAAKMSAMLAAEVKKPKAQSLFSKPKNKTGGFRKGMYKLRIGRKAIPKNFKVPEQPKVSSQFTGKAGEYAVMSELLFFGFNVSAMTVDDGIDIVASKNDSYFHIQVKTSNASASNKFQFKITKRVWLEGCSCNVLRARASHL